MFELNKKINDWHDELIANQSMTEIDVDELMSHLKDNIEDLEKKGLSGEESYWVARHRLGDTRALDIEFAKVNQALIWRKRIFWLLLGYFLFTTISYLAKLATISLQLLDLQWLFVRIPITGFQYPLPIPMFLFILLIIGGIFFMTTSQRNIFKKNGVNHFKFIPGVKIGHKFIMAFSGFYLVIIFGNFLSTSASTNRFSAATIGAISVSGSIFSLLWNIFLFITLVIMTLVLEKRKNDNVIV